MSMMHQINETDFIREASWSWRPQGVNTTEPVFWELVPAHAHRRWMTWSWYLHSDQDSDWQDYGMAQLDIFALPVYDTMTRETFMDKDGIRDLLMLKVPRVETIHSLAPLDLEGTDPDEDARTVARQQLIYRPDRFMTGYLTHVDTPQTLYHNRMYLGHEAGAYKTVSNDSTTGRYHAQGQSFIGASISTGYNPMYIVGALTIPPPIGKNDYPIGQSFPSGRTWEELDFLATEGSPIGIGQSRTVGNINDHRRWAIYHHVDDDDGADHFKQEKLAFRCRMQSLYTNKPRVRTTVAPHSAS